MFLGAPPDQGGQLPSQVRRRLVSPLLGQSGVPREVQEAHRRRTMQSTEQTGPFQRILDILEGALGHQVAFDLRREHL
jgi:hypothetical protein